LLRRPLAASDVPARARAARPVAPRGVAAGGAAESSRRRAIAGRPAAVADAAELQAVRGSRRSGYLASLAAGHDEPSVVWGPHGHSGSEMVVRDVTRLGADPGRPGSGRHGARDRRAGWADGAAGA